MRIPNDQLPQPPELPLGFYKHFREGDWYLVVCVAGHSGHPHDFFVTYWSLSQRRFWVRPYADFVASVKYEGRTVPRFVFFGQSLPDDAATSSLPPQWWMPS